MKADESWRADARKLVLNPASTSIKHYRSAMHQAVEHACQWLARDQLYSGRSPDQLTDEITTDFSSSGIGAEAALHRAARFYLDNSVAPHHPHCAAHLHCPTLVITQAAEVLINAANQSLDSWDQAPSASVIEIKLLEWLRERAGYPAGDAGVFTSGGTQSNLMGLLLARDRLVQRVWGRSVRDKGLPPDARRIKVLCSEAAHFSIGKNMALLGLGWASVVSVPTTATGQIDLTRLEDTIRALIAAGEHIAAIVGTAGTTDAGAIDPLSALGELARQYGIWLHVDAAWGGALLLSARHLHRLAGLELADSITIDFHKHFLQPISCSAFLLKNAADFEFIRCQADYLNPASDDERGIPNLVSRSLQTTRRFDALKLWMSLEALGVEQFGAFVDDSIRLASQTAELVRNTAEFELVMRPQLSSVLFRLAPARVDPQQLDTLNQYVADSLFEAGKANIGVTRLRGQACLKLTLLNPLCTMDDIGTLLTMIRSQARHWQASIAETSA